MSAPVKNYYYTDRYYNSGPSGMASKNYPDADAYGFEASFEDSGAGYDVYEAAKTGEEDWGFSEDAADVILAEIEAAMPMRETIQELEGRIDALKKTIESFDFPSKGLSEKQELLKKLNQAKSALDLGTTETELEEVDEAILTVESDFEGIKEAYAIAREETGARLDEKKHAILAALEVSHLSEAEKENFKARVEAIQANVGAEPKNGSLRAEDAFKALEQIDAEAGEISRFRELANLFKGLPAKIPNAGAMSRDSADLALEVKRALRSGDWESVKSFLARFQKLPADSGDADGVIGTYWEGGPVIMRFLGALSLLVDRDEDKLDRMLDLLPKDVRREMIRVGKIGGLENLYGAADAATMESYAFYGSPKITVDRLWDSLHWTEEHAQEKTLLTQQGPGAVRGTYQE